MKFKRVVVFTLTTLITGMSITGCGDKPTKVDNTNANNNVSISINNNGDSEFIANRHIVIRTFNDDLEPGPSDKFNNPITQEIKRRTGITWEVQYTSGARSIEQLTTAFVAGDMPDAIIYYLNNSARQEFPVIRKGALEGMLTDIAPMLRQTKIYSKYYDPDYMPTDSYENIVQRPEFNGATYHVPMRIERYEGSNDFKLRGGMYIQKNIVDALNINPWEIKTSDDLYNLLIKIKESNFKDSYGNPVTPLGPTYWGGGNELPGNAIADMSVGGESNSFAYINGELVHEIETPYVMEQILFVRKLINEGLLHKEALTIEDVRAKEGAYSYSWGIIQSVHSRTDIFNECDYVPFKLNNIDNEYVEYKSGKSQYGAWSIPSTTKNPEEVVKFADFMASKEGKLLWRYGLEGEHYTIKDSKVYPTDMMMKKYKDGDRKFLMDLNINADIGSEWGKIFGETDLAFEEDFGELEYGTNVDPELNAKAMYLYNYGLDERPYEKTIYKKGFNPLSYIDDFETGLDLRPLLDAKAYNEIKVRAVFAKTETEAKNIINDYLFQMNRFKLQEFKEHLNDIKKSNPDMLFIEEYN